MWKTYYDRTGRRPDFKIKYHFIPHENGGRHSLPYQGYRSDFIYEGQDLSIDGFYMIYPEFLNPDGSIMLEDKTEVPESGEALMWILYTDTMHEHHRERAYPGRRGWLIESGRKVAEATIIELIALADPLPDKIDKE